MNSPHENYHTTGCDYYYSLDNAATWTHISIGSTKVPVSDNTMYIKCEPTWVVDSSCWEVKYDDNKAKCGNATVAGMPVVATIAVKQTSPQITLASVPNVSAGYTCSGWVTTPDGTIPVSDDYTVTGNTTLYACWTAFDYSISYKDEGGDTFSGTHEASYPVKHTYGTATTLDSPTKDGYSFGGYFFDSDCTQAANGSVGATAKTADFTLYAKWIPKEYNITYKDKGGSAFSGVHAALYPTTHTYGTDTTLDNPTKAGYTFGGYFFDSGCTGSVVTSIGATGKEADFTLYAKWQVQEP